MPKYMNKRMALKDGEQIRVNLRATVNSDLVKHETRDGREVIVVQSATLPDDVVMNNIFYPAAEIEAGYKSLEGSPAPLGHPTVDDMFVSARSPLGLNIGYFGAWNDNVRRKDGRVFIDKVIDVERANESKMGRRVLEALNKGEPIHTSTGLLMYLRETNREDADHEGYDMEFDHDAILLDENGAATPEQGVGMMVNKARGDEGQKMNVVNSDVLDYLDDQIDYLGMELMEAIGRKSDREEAASAWDQLKGAFFEAIGLRRETNSLKKEINMATENDGSADYAAMNDRVGAVETALGTLTETLNGIATKFDAVNGFIEGLAAERRVERDTLVNKVVEAELLTQEEAEATPEKALQALLNASKPAKKGTPAPGVSGVFAPNNETNVEQFSPLGAKKEA